MSTDPTLTAERLRELLDYNSDNRLVNLREATRIENCRNTTPRTDGASGLTGVGWHKCTGRWRAYITIDGRHTSLGYFPTAAEASAAYWVAKHRCHPS
jgi:hypothetical protein